MPSFGWRELALLVVVLFALTALLRSGNSNADPRHLISAAPNDAAALEAATPPKTPTIAATASREVSRVQETDKPPRRPPSPSPAAVPREEAGRTRSDPAPRTASPAPGRPAAATTATVATATTVTASVPTPAETFWVGCANPAGFVGDGRIFFPLPGAYLGSYGNTWGAPRPQGGHEGTDLMVPAGTPELAVTDGTLVPVAGSNANGWNSLGGYAVMLRADYSIGPIKAGDLFYYAHLNARSQLAIGARVRAGEVLGYAGDTGQGPEVTRGLFPPHLHFGWYDGSGARGTRSAVPSGAINPYAMLEWIKANGDAGGSNAGRCAAPGVGAPVPAAPPATEGRWPADDSPGVGPDLDTGSGNPSPAPAPGAREATPHRTADHAKNEASKAPAQRNPRKGDEPTREAATPKPRTGTSGREPSASTTPTTAAPAPAKPPGRPNPEPPSQDSRAPKPTKPEPPRAPGTQGSHAGRPGAQDPGVVDAPKPVSPNIPAPIEDPPPRPGSLPDVTGEIEETVGTIPGAPAGSDSGAWIPDLPSVEREEDRDRNEGQEATTDERGVEERPAEAPGTAEPAEG